MYLYKYFDLFPAYFVNTNWASFVLPNISISISIHTLCIWNAYIIFYYYFEYMNNFPCIV